MLSQFSVDQSINQSNFIHVSKYSSSTKKTYQYTTPTLSKFLIFYGVCCDVTGPSCCCLMVIDVISSVYVLFYFVTYIPAIKTAFQHANNQLTCKSLL